jgi:DNA-binding GntR family transcriptional regulator
MEAHKPTPDGRLTQEVDAEGTQRVLLKDLAYQEIKNRILDGRYSPGTFLAERWLADKLGMSKTPVRAAIGRLEAEGFLTVSPQQGIVVREMSFHEIVDHFDIRVALETFVVRNLAGHVTAEQERRLRAVLDEQRAQVEACKVGAYVALDAEYHLLFCQCLGNQEIIRVMARQRDKLYRIIARVLQQGTVRMTSSHAEHVSIFEAVLDGRGDEAAALVQRHLEYGKRSLVAP